ncbi:15-cis-zeta-carotene isomerase, chloroplastic [Capsicum baccatum]|uniref:15-cis-zeta-carotene isomerase, chloroplastic n=1 Tax=Capsicum baccatum TaxID=33114 RepID=A0A2G2VJ44_CAPBA|nr:15-cis-zeta-carotene isomerase, chloroplastic [Capsicum baccatum]
MSNKNQLGKIVMLSLTLIFAIVHSGLASLRDKGEELIGERAFRVLFAGISLPLAVSTIVYFINHRYDGVQLWQVNGIAGVHELVWVSNFISFFFLYPSTFNLLEVAAVDKPKMHLWETGIMRITRHPQVIWCLAHTLWIGNSVAVAASVGLIGHHLFGAWNGDRRLAIRYGEAFEVVKERTSIIPFAAILDGRQKLPGDYYKEFIRLPYLSITALTLGAYFLHPIMQAASYRLHCPPDNELNCLQLPNHVGIDLNDLVNSTLPSISRGQQKKGDHKATIASGSLPSDNFDDFTTSAPVEMVTKSKARSDRSLAPRSKRRKTDAERKKSITVQENFKAHSSIKEVNILPPGTLT